MQKQYTFKEGLDYDLAEAWLTAEETRVLDNIDPDRIWGRPATAAGLEAAFTSTLPERLSKAEPWRRGKVTGLLQGMIYDGFDCVGFSALVLIQRPDSDVNGWCRICYEDSGDAGLVDGCACRGSVRFVHAACLIRQWESAGKPESMMCTLCKQTFVAGAAKVLEKAAKEAVNKRKSDLKGILSSLPVDQREKLLSQQISAATLSWQQGKLKEAAQAFREALKDVAGVLPEDHTQVLTAHHNLGLVLQAQNDLESAAKHIRSACVGFAAKLGEKHALTLKARHNEGLIAQKRNSFTEAHQVYAHVLLIRKEVLGPRHVDTLKTSCNLGLVLHQMKRCPEAQTVLRETLEGLEHVLGRAHPLALITMQNLSLAMSEGDPKSAEAIRLAREAAEGRLTALGEDSADTMEGWRDLGSVLNNAGQYEEAEQVWRQALRGQQRVLGPGHPTTLETFRLLKKALEQQGRSEAAQKLGAEVQSSTTIAAVPLPAKPGPIIAVVLCIYILPEHRGRGLGKATMEHWRTVATSSSAVALQAWLPVSDWTPVDVPPPLADFFTKAASMTYLAERHGTPLGNGAVNGGPTTSEKDSGALEKTCGSTARRYAHMTSDLVKD